MSTAIQFTLAQYDRMIREGIFADHPERRLELIYGEVREMSPPGPTHEEVVDLLNEWSVLNIAKLGLRVRVQNSIGIPALDSAPQPDIAWVRAKSYREARPRPSDVLLLIEVSDSSVDYDLGEKRELYAAAGIREYWVVNLPHRQVEVFRRPLGRGYQQSQVHGIAEQIKPRTVKNVTLRVGQLFGS